MSTNADAAIESAAGAAGFGSFRKRIYRFPELARSLAEMWRRRADVRAVWRGERVDRGFRERIMVAVAQVNECRYCSFVHRSWAEDAGVSADEIERIAGLDFEDVDPRERRALAWSRARAEADFAPAPEAVERAFHASFDENARADVELVARAMTIANRSANTLDALLSRLRGRPAAGSRVLDEIAVSALVVLVLLAVAPLAMRHRRTGPVGLLREFHRFSSAFELAGRGP